MGCGTSKATEATSPEQNGVTHSNAPAKTPTEKSQKDTSKENGGNPGHPEALQPVLLKSGEHQTSQLERLRWVCHLSLSLMLMQSKSLAEPA
jgi:hypothetical protein